jgi:hypothetical protein
MSSDSGSQQHPGMLPYARFAEACTNLRNASEALSHRDFEPTLLHDQVGGHRHVVANISGRRLSTSVHCSTVASISGLRESSSTRAASHLRLQEDRKNASRK